MAEINTNPDQARSSWLNLLRQSIKGEAFDYTEGSIRNAVVLLAIPMILEMILESVFALVDLYFVGHLPNSAAAIQVVGLTESILSIIYALAIGLSMAATAVVARRIGEKQPELAARAGMQAMIVAFVINIFISTFGFIYGQDILLLMGASPGAAVAGAPFIQIMMAGSFIIVLLFLINGIFRGAGNAAIAMRSLWIANISNIILCPIFINGFGPVPAFGLTGAAIATTIGRSIGVLYQVYNLVQGSGVLKMKLKYLSPEVRQIIVLLKIAAPAVLQFVIASCSWIFLAQLVATTGGDHGSAGYQTALRILMFFILPAWGLSNAASTLVGQNLGANKVGRAEQAVKQTAIFSICFMALVMLVSYVFGSTILGFFTDDPLVQQIAVQATYIMSLGYIFYGIGMVLVNAFNGAGDTWTPTWINFFGFWLFQIPLAYLLAKFFELGPTGVFIAVPVAETAICIASYFVFRKGRWKTIKV
jgi:putative MATE family efflux protein